jgi:hypothetical protein
LELVVEQISKLTGIPEKGVQKDTPLTAIGIDSLLSVELKNWIDNNLCVSYPVFELTSGITVHDLVIKLVDMLMEQSPQKDTKDTKDTKDIDVPVPLDQQK